MQYKVVSDSSSNLFSFEGLNYASVPLKIRSTTTEYVDAPGVDVAAMVEDLHREKTAARTSCPNVYEWLEAFEGADAVFAVAITSNLSGSCSAAQQAAQEYMDTHEGAKVCVLDSLSTGPEMHLIIERLRALIDQALPFEEIEEKIRAYMQHTHLLFTLRSLENLAKNGRVSPAVAKIAGVLGICVVGKASDVGTLEQMHKCRGEKRALETMVREFEAMGYRGGRMRIAHCLNLRAAQQLQAMVLARHPQADVTVGECTALCTYYAEMGGLLVGFEDGQP